MRSPIAAKQTASIGLPASSPQNEMGVCVLLHRSTIISMNDKKLTFRLSYRLRTRSFSRSAAKKNCLRSLPPMDKKSTSSKNASGAKARDGVSNMAPTSMFSGRICPSASSRLIALVRAARAWVNSSYWATKGNITVSARPFAARKSACNCILKTPGLSRPTRIARQPNAGFGSSCGFI